MLEKIFNMIIYFFGGVTFSLILVFIVTSIAEKIQIKIKKGKDPKVNIKHINGLIYRIKKEGYTVKAKGKYLQLDDVLEVELSDRKIE
ncbi:hypothetical protein EV204_105233 [Tissierella praeacuta]|uniref:hypothetical protein n=1 Tax=Tissierella praeacuta TaxID=43131 RepID=UPI00104A28EB|nr:hypothetical protein [Tissierella praeacuta]TCU72897.1 hypothetical protein EV204_105233 [Tissierella praeacuta]